MWGQNAGHSYCDDTFTPMTNKHSHFHLIHTWLGEKILDIIKQDTHKYTRYKIHVVSIPKYHKCLTSFSIYFYHDFIVFIIIMVVVVVHSYILSCHVSSVQQRRTEATQNILFATTWHSKNKTNNRLSCALIHALTQKWMHVGLYCYCWLLLLLLGQEAHDTTHLTRVVITFYFYYVHRVSVYVCFERCDNTASEAVEWYSGGVIHTHTHGHMAQNKWSGKLYVM